MVALINNNCQLCSLILKLLNFHNGKLSTVVREGFCYPDLLSLHVAEVRCSALIRRRKKAEEQRPKICRKRTNVRKLWPKRKFTHFCLARKFCSIIFHCYSANLLQILIAQNGTSRILSSLLKEAEPGSRDACESDRRIIPLMEERSSAALHFPDLNSILEFGESFENSHVLPEYFTYPLTLLTARCRRSETSLSYHSKWLLSQSLTVEAALSLPQLLPSSAVTVDVSYASPTQCSNRRVSVHCTANFIVHCLRKHSQFTISADSSSNLKSSSLWQYDCEYFNSLKLLFLLIILLVKGSNALLFSGAPGSYAR
ncbi:unnamed protein product [Litomosoides sigmodontis]|uniref:Uncharacterized protein n=1 Tax=Litomosoides sigmodontis TaxID=42156 RepID=A0A3P6VA66_LITSI|nr:unnamed protein product [Litomosoides sigmodontis]